MSIVINEKDNTLYGTRTADTDNIVYVPGSAITGPSDPTLYTSYNDFVKNCGDHGCEGSLTWEYVANILLAGFPVLFQRITHSGTATTSPVEIVKHAKAEVKDDSSNIVIYFEEIYGGTYGNDLKVSLVKEYETIYLRLYYKTSIIETFKIASVTDEMNTEDTNKAVLNGLLNVESSKIKINIPDESNYVFKEINNLQLSGGKDADETTVLEEIAEADYKNSIYMDLEDKYIHNIKFIVSGGYIDTNLTVAKNLTQLAENRKDCVAFVDLPMGIEKGVANRYFNTINSSYAAAFAPWCYTELSTKSKKWMPPSFVFLVRLARSVIDNGNPLWYPVAGVKRASLSNVLKTEYEIGGTMLDEWQELNQQALNPIMKLRSYGYVIYGQRTLYATDDSNYPSPSALRQLGVRITANEVKRAIFDIAIGLKYEKNDLYTWNEFTTLLKPLLNSMKSDRGITDYQLLMNAKTTTEEDIQEYRIRGIVKISVLNSAENFEIDFSLEPSSVTFSDETLV